MFVNFSRTNVITVTEIARTVKNPVFIPKIINTKEANSAELSADMFARSIFSGDANLGTLRTAFARNKTNRDTDTVFT